MESRILMLHSAPSPILVPSRFCPAQELAAPNTHASSATQEKRDLSTQLLKSKRVLIEKVELAFADNSSYVTSRGSPNNTNNHHQPPTTTTTTTRYVLSEASFGRQKRFTAARLNKE